MDSWSRWVVGLEIGTVDGHIDGVGEEMLVSEVFCDVPWRVLAAAVMVVRARDEPVAGVMEGTFNRCNISCMIEVFQYLEGGPGEPKSE